MQQKKIEEGQSLMSEGDKLSQSGFFKKPQWDAAANAYVKAATAFKVAKDNGREKEAHKKAANCYNMSDSKFHAAKQLELASGCCQDVGEKIELFKMASGLYRDNGNIETAAKSLMQAAEAAEKEQRYAEAFDVYNEAASCFASELGGANIGEGKALEQAMRCAMRGQQLDKAQETLRKMRVRWEERGNYPEAHRCAAAEVVMRATRGDAVGAEREHMRALQETEGYGGSDIGGAMDGWLDALKKQDVAVMEKLARGHLQYLEPEVVKLMRQMTRGMTPAPEQEEKAPMKKKQQQQPSSSPPPSISPRQPSQQQQQKKKDADEEFDMT